MDKLAYKQKLTHSQVSGWTHSRVHQSVVAESWDSKGAPDFQHYKGVEGRARSPGIKLGRGTNRSSLNLHPQTNHTGLVSHSGTPLGVETSHGHFGPQDSPRPRLGGNHHLPPYSILCNAPLRLHPNGSFSRDSQVGVPKLSRNCPEIVPSGVPGLWELITPDCQVRSRRGLNQSCSPCWDLFNVMSHSQFGGWEEVDSRLLVVGSQTTNLTPGSSFAHNLGDRCPNGQCEAIFDIYASRPFQWH